MAEAAATCSTCPYRHDRGLTGFDCRYRAPAAEPITNLAAWPRVMDGDWCADHPDFTPPAPPPPPGAPRLL